jgi:hypothetical protein
MKKTDKHDKRILARRVAAAVKAEDLKAVNGGKVTCSGGCADDCGYEF